MTGAAARDAAAPVAGDSGAMGTHITAAGLVLDFVGVVILFYWGSPPRHLTMDGSTFPSVRNPELRRIQVRDFRVSQAGMILLAMGFFLQLVGNYWGRW